MIAIKQCVVFLCDVLCAVAVHESYCALAIATALRRCGESIESAERSKTTDFTALGLLHFCYKFLFFSRIRSHYCLESAIPARAIAIEQRVVFLGDIVRCMDHAALSL